MDKQNIAYKLTNDVIKNYGLEKLEKDYNLSGANLFVAIYNEIFLGLSIPSETPKGVKTFRPSFLPARTKFLIRYSSIPAAQFF